MPQSEILQNETTRTAWALLEAMRRSKNIQISNEQAMQALMREFAMEVCKQQPYNDRIVAGGVTLIKFPNREFSSKTDYLQYHSQNTVWGEDAILFPALEALGYQPVIHLQGTSVPPYAPFVQQVSDNPLRMDIVNYGAASGGYHWELKGNHNSGGVNCMYYTMAQQVQKNIAEVQAALPNSLVTEIQEHLQAANNIINTPKHVREDNVVTKELNQQFQNIEKTDEQRRQTLAKKLDKFTTADLAAFFKFAAEVDGDYLKGRLKEIAKDCGFDHEDSNNFMRKAIEQSIIDPDLESIIREELIHALSVNAKRGEHIYNSFMNLDVSKIPAAEAAKNYAEQIKQHPGTNSFNAQPGFKPPRLTK